MTAAASGRVRNPRGKGFQRKHGLSETPEYRAWQTMRHRCTSPSSPAWADYGGRGITICDRWLDDPAAFLADMGPKPSPKHEIDRIDNDDGYSPENCRWATRSENDRNRRSTVWVEYRGEQRRLIDLCEQFGTRRDLVGERISRGWSVEAAVETSPRSLSPKGKGKKQKKTDRVLTRIPHEQKREIYRLHHEVGCSGADLARQFGRSETAIYSVVHDERWGP